jgi:hypothetical protein
MKSNHSTLAGNSKTSWGVLGAKIALKDNTKMPWGKANARAATPESIHFKKNKARAETVTLGDISLKMHLPGQYVLTSVFKRATLGIF